MAVLRIRTWGDPVLKTRAKEIDKVTTEIRTLAQDMMETMQAEGNAVGLAANQVGVAKRLFVVEIASKKGPSKRYTLINPEIIATTKECEIAEEGCLSFPGIWGPVERKVGVKIQGMDLEGKSVTLEGEGLLARAFQHELDHLDGMVFVERMSMVHRVMLNRQLKELVKHTKAVMAGRGTPKI
jgi:peptide deformylase